MKRENETGRSRGSSAFPVLLVAVCAGKLISCGPDPAPRRASAEELHLAANPARDDAEFNIDSVPASLRDIFAHNVPLEGCWKWSWLPGYDSTALCVTRTGEATFELEFLRSTDFGASREHRTTATWSGTGLVLAEPLQVMSRPTRILYPVRVLEEPCLVPDACLDKWKPGQPLFGENRREEFAFRRAEDGLIGKRREERRAFEESRQARDGGK